MPELERHAASGEHTEHEDHGWSVEIPDHPGRTESEEFRHSKETAHKILAEMRTQHYPALLTGIAGPGGVQAHHAGSLFVWTNGWSMFLNVAGVEWSAQFAADPAKVDALRQNAQVLYEAFPGTLDRFEKLGYHEARTVLETPITNAAGVTRWTDSIYNSCVLLSPGLHQGLDPARTQVGGWHHFPKSIWDQQVTKRDDFQLWVTSGDGLAAAVAPVAPHGSQDGRVEVIYAQPGSALHKDMLKAHASGKPHILDADHPLAQQAFARQTTTEESA